MLCHNKIEVIWCTCCIYIAQYVHGYHADEAGGRVYKATKESVEPAAKSKEYLVESVEAIAAKYWWKARLDTGPIRCPRNPSWNRIRLSSSPLKLYTLIF